MHILLIHQAFSGLDEAGGTRHIEMARTLARHGHQVTIIASPVSYLTGKSKSEKMKWVEKQCPEEGIIILRTYTYQAFHRNFLHRVFSFLSFMFSSFWVGLSVRNVDVIWGTSPPIFQGWTAWALARVKGARFLFEVRDLWPAFAIEVGVLRNPVLIRMSLWLERFLYRHADRLIVNSPGFIEHVAGHGGKDVRLISNGADPAMFHPEADGRAFRERCGWGDQFIVLYAGAHGMSNDLGVVLGAAELLGDHPNIRFVLVGDGKEKHNLMRQAAEMRLNQVEFLPPVPKQEMADVLAAANACIAILKPLELYKTTYPNKVFDYMAAGRPVILAIDGVSRKVVEEAEAGMFSPPGDAQAMAGVVRTLAENPARARQMGANGRKYIETHLNRELIAEQMLKLMVELTAKNSFH